MKFEYASVLDCIREEVDRAEKRLVPVKRIILTKKEYDSVRMELGLPIELSERPRVIFLMGLPVGVEE
jgi:hypothetical protein